MINNNQDSKTDKKNLRIAQACKEQAKIITNHIEKANSGDENSWQAIAFIISSSSKEVNDIILEQLNDNLQCRAQEVLNGLSR